MKKRLGLTAALALLLACPALAAAPSAFTATYDVLRDGSPLGRATVRLAPAGGATWDYAKHIEGTAGMAAMLGASLEERSRIVWRDGLPQTLTYDYRLDTGFKRKQRHLAATHGKVTVEDGKAHLSYPAVPGMVERNTESLAIGLALRAGRRDIVLPVAVKQEVQTQRFSAHGRESIKVPAGTFQAIRVERTDADRGFTAWYAPSRFPVPVQISQRDGGNFTMKLVDYQER